MKRRKVSIVVGLAVLVVAALAARYGFTTISIEDAIPEQIYEDPLLYADEIWSTRLPVAIENAVELHLILREMKPDAGGIVSPDSLIPIAEEYGRVTEGDMHVYMVNGSGRVVSVNTETELGTAEVALDGYEGPIKTLIYIGTRIPSHDTSVRDAAGANFREFRSMGFSEVAQEINARILSYVLDKWDRDDLIGKSISFTGAFIIYTFNQVQIDLKEIYIVPVVFEVLE